MGVIDRIVIENFKSLRRVDLSLGRMNLFIGANASGKSNFLDALRVLQGIGNGFTISEILDGKPKSAASEVWGGIRGGSSCLYFEADRADSSAALSDAVPDEVTIKVHGSSEGRPERVWEYVIAFLPAAGRVSRERLEVGTVIYDYDHAIGPYSPRAARTIRVRCYPKGTGEPTIEHFESARPVLGQIARGSLLETVTISNLAKSVDVQWQADLASGVVALLTNMQRLHPEPPLLRSYSGASAHVARMGEHGENFASLIAAVCRDPGRKDAYLSWLRELRPEEVNDVGVVRGALGEPLFMLEEGGRKFPAPALSDGTLRFAALAAAFFQPDMPKVMTIEEIENGVHPGRLRLLMELLRSQSERTDTQIIATTHSPLLIEWLQPEEHKTTFFCKRSEATGESEIRPLTEVPHFVDTLKKRGQKISDLFSEGWLEAAL